MSSSLASSLKVPSGWRLFKFPTIDSTNEELMRRADSGESEGLVIQADVQTVGRGRRGRVWESPVGNLYLSVLVDAPISSGGEIGFTGALALIDALEMEVGRSIIDLRCKWPNDLLLNKKKVAGILLEALPNHQQVIVGFGVNLVSTQVNDTLYPVGALTDMGLTVDPQRLALQLCRSLESWLAVWRNDGFAALRMPWLERAEGLHEPIVVSLPFEKLQGYFQGLSANGGLVLAQDSGERIIPAGDVFFGPERIT
ncbi:MAG: biotin--[acetyl-CoA-carboxylase] ligase [Rhodospirillaceae bacterium]